MADRKTKQLLLYFMIPWRIKGAIIQVGARHFEFTSATSLGLKSPTSLTPAQMTRDLPKGSAATPEEERELWLERKRKYAESIAHKTPQALRVTTADKVHNAESILDSHAVYGAEVWSVSEQSLARIKSMSIGACMRLSMHGTRNSQLMRRAICRNGFYGPSISWSCCREYRLGHELCMLSDGDVSSATADSPEGTLLASWWAGPSGLDWLDELVKEGRPIIAAATAI